MADPLQGVSDAIDTYLSGLSAADYELLEARVRPPSELAADNDKPAQRPAPRSNGSNGKAEAARRFGNQNGSLK